MLSKLITLVFVALVSVAPASALAIDNPTSSVAKESSLAIEKLTSEATAQAIKVESQNGQARNVAGNLNPKEQPASGWTLVLALFSFVMLSNRLGL